MSAAYSIIDKEDGVVKEKHRLSCEKTTACLIVILSICVNLTLGVTILLSINLGYGTELASRTSSSRHMTDRYSVCTECHYFGHAEKQTRHGRFVQRVETNDGQICCLHQAESLWRLLNLIHMKSLMQQPTSPGQVSVPPPSAHLYLDTLQATGFIGSTCQQSTECSVPSSVCVNSECMCDPGLSFSPQQKSCVSTCTTYGPHYTKIRGYYIGGNNMATYTGVTEQQCMDRCSSKTNFVCRSADLRTSDGRCDLSSQTLLTVASSDYRIEADPTIITQFSRDCEA